MMDLAELLRSIPAESQETQIVELDIDLSHPMGDMTQAARCRVLAVAILKNLILDIAGEAIVDPDTTADVQRRRAKAEGRAYVFDDESHGPFSFIWLCECLGVDVEWFRSKVRAGEHVRWAGRIKTEAKVCYLQASNVSGNLPRMSGCTS